MKLYSVTNTAKEYSGCRNVAFNWFRHAMPQGRRPYADLLMIVRRKPDATIDARMQTNSEAAAGERLIRNGR
jgi:hypothetical protein